MKIRRFCFSKSCFLLITLLLFHIIILNSFLSADKPVRGGYLRRAYPIYIGLMNPNHWPVNDFLSITYFYDRLILYDKEYRPRVPFLAKSWKYVNPVTVIMKLRKGVRFHDGTLFNAGSLKYQIEWIMDKRNNCWSRSYLEPVKSIDVIDEYTVRWRLKRVWTGFSGTIASVPGYVLSSNALKADITIREVIRLEKKIKQSKKKLAKYERKGKAARADKSRKKISSLENELSKARANVKGHRSMDLHPVGTGPYMLEDASPGNYLKMKRNPNWWRGRLIGKPERPYLDGIKVIVIPDASVQLANMRAGKIDSMFLNKIQYKMAKNDPNIKSHVYPENHMIGLRFNHSRKPCSDIRVRRAISHAIDRKALIHGTEAGLGRIASCFFPEDHFAHNPGLKPVRYNPGLTKKLLAKAGYTNGLTVKGYVGYTVIAQTRAEALKQMLAKAGINWEIEALDLAAGTEKMKSGDYDLADGTYAWIFGADSPISNLYLPDGSFNYGRSYNKKAIALIKAARKEMNFTKKQKLYHKLEKTLYDNYEDAWIFWDVAIRSFRKNVMGFDLNKFLAGKEEFWWSQPLWLKDGHQ